MDSNSLYYGDNLDILRRYVRDESADLIYLDPPFNSNQTYNVLFQEKDGSQSASQIKAFGDTWHWDETAARSYEETVEAGGQTAEAMQAFRKPRAWFGGRELAVRMTSCRVNDNLAEVRFTLPKCPVVRSGLH